MAKAQTKKVAANKLKPGDKIVFKQLTATIKVKFDADKEYPVFDKTGILCIKLDGNGGPWKGVSGSLLIKDSDMVEIERSPGPISWLTTKFGNWLLTL